MKLPRRLRMDRAAYITISERPLGGGGRTATIIGWDMADVIVNSRLSEIDKHRAFFGDLVTIAVERLMMAGVIKRPISARNLEALASDVFAMLTVNGLYRPVRRSAAERFFRLGPEPPPRLRWSTMEEYEELQRRLEGDQPVSNRGRAKPTLRRRRHLRLVESGRMKGGA
jgi:hypothetical protein